jgi:hypothetical protein
MPVSSPPSRGSQVRYSSSSAGLELLCVHKLHRQAKRSAQRTFAEASSVKSFKNRKTCTYLDKIQKSNIPQAVPRTTQNSDGQRAGWLSHCGSKGTVDLGLFFRRVVLLPFQVLYQSASAAPRDRHRSRGSVVNLPSQLSLTRVLPLEEFSGHQKRHFGVSQLS